jgi:hypothetical protein
MAEGSFQKRALSVLEQCQRCRDQGNSDVDGVPCGSEAGSAATCGNGDGCETTCGLVSLAVEWLEHRQRRGQWQILRGTQGGDEEERSEAVVGGRGRDRVGTRARALGAAVGNRAGQQRCDPSTAQSAQLTSTHRQAFNTPHPLYSFASAQRPAPSTQRSCDAPWGRLLCSLGRHGWR